METFVKADVTQDVLDKVKQVRNIAAKGKVITPAVRFTTLHERQDLEKEFKEIDGIINAPPWAKENITQAQKEELYTRRENLEASLEGNRPPKLDGKTRDALVDRLDEVETQIKTGMLSEEEMWRNPAGSVDRHRKWEAKNKDAILERRNILIALEPDSDDVERTSVETLRPQLARQGNVATFMVDAQLPGHFAQTPRSKANFDKVFPDSPTIDTPLKQVERQEIKTKRTYHKNRGKTEVEKSLGLVEV